ncbi:hypothetical protein bsdtw1_02735 [Clostridium fungisolvens]|uniref:Uncharacterized protein n=2 Tax=Clostridium fungisolvens TaxID=1604897 RepID=A0A6V8SJA2_9CLOT|nr:hypothetical protein bsdtw1_02735 [Clostridium fungisolvens]
MYTLIRVIMSIIWISLAYKFADWKNWKIYYPTLLFYGMGDLIYNVAFKDNLLWKFEVDYLVPSINGLFIYFAIFVPIILLYLSKFPKQFIYQVGYILLWIGIFTSIELFTTSIGMQKNYNNWNIWWSVLHNVIMFPIIILHHKKHYVLSWSTALIFLVFIMNIFKVPIFLSK